MRHTAQAVRYLGVVAAIAAIVAAAGCGSKNSAKATAAEPTVTVTRAGAASSSSVSTCTTANLAFALGTSDGAAGHVYLPLILTNTGSAPCTVSGFPGVSFVTGTDSHQVGNPADRTQTTPATLTLQPGAKASTTIGVTQAGNYDAAMCTPTPVTGFRIYPPNETNAASVPYAATGCANTGVTILTVTPLVAAA